MANFVVINDNTLRQRLRQFGFRPDGPITDTTRDVYVRKLQQLERTRGGQTNTTSAQTTFPIPFQFEQLAPRTTSPRHQGNINSNATAHLSNRSSLSAAGPAILPLIPPLQVNHHQDELVARSAPSEDTNRSGAIVHGSLGNRFLANFNDSTHVTSDVCFTSLDGTLLFASRALLVTSCPGMTHLLYNTSEPLPICLYMAAGSMIIWCHLDDSVRSIKYKISLLKGIPVVNQTVLLDGRILVDDATLYSCGVRTNSLLEVQASSRHAVVNFRATSINPSLSIVRFTPLASTRGGHELPIMSQEVSLPHQVTQLVIVSDVAGRLLNDFIRYLYTGNIAVTLESAPTLCALSEAFTIQDLQELCLNVIDDNINNTNVKDLLSFSHCNQIHSLKEHCLRYIRTGQCNVDQLCQHFCNNPELVQDIINNSR